MHDLLHRLESRPSTSAVMPPSFSSALTSEAHLTHSPSCAPSSTNGNSPNKSHQAPTKIRTHRRRSQVSAHSSHVPSSPAIPCVSSVSTREPHLQSSETSSRLVHSRKSSPVNTILRPNYANRCNFRLPIGTHPLVISQITHHSLFGLLFPLDIQSRHHRTPCRDE